jgi:hypothetical protein
MLTKKDFDEIEHLVKDVVQGEIKYLPTKDDFYKEMDELMGEVKAMREEQELHSGQHANIDDEFESHKLRLSKLEKQISLPSASA